MIRPLTKEEAKACRQGINNRKKTIAELTQELGYFEEFNAFNLKWAKYLDDKEKKSKARKKLVIEQTLEGLKATIADEQKSMKTEQDQLINGVKVKEPPVGVN